MNGRAIGRHEQVFDLALAHRQQRLGRVHPRRRGAHRMLAGIYACLGEIDKAQEAYKVFHTEADEQTVSEYREEWKTIWTAPGSLERWLDHMRLAGMKD